MFTFTIDRLAEYLLTNFNNVDDDDYSGKTTKVYILAWRGLSTLEQEKVVNAVNDKIKDQIGSIIQQAIKDVVQSVDLTE